MASLAILENIVSEFPDQLQIPVRHLAQWTEEQLKVPREDFLKLSQTVERLADSQTRTEQQVQELTVQVKELAAAQARTEQQVKELAAVHKGTEQQIQKLVTSVQELVVAQRETEQRMKKFAEDLEASRKSLLDQIAALGSRWGIYNEGTFRATIHGLKTSTARLMTITRGKGLSRR